MSGLFYAVRYNRRWHWVRFYTKSDGPQFAWTYAEAKELLMTGTNLWVKEERG